MHESGVHPRCADTLASQETEVSDTPRLRVSVAYRTGTPIGCRSRFFETTRQCLCCQIAEQIQHSPYSTDAV